MGTEFQYSWHQPPRKVPLDEPLLIDTCIDYELDFSLFPGLEKEHSGCSPIESALMISRPSWDEVRYHEPEYIETDFCQDETHITGWVNEDSGLIELIDSLDSTHNPRPPSFDISDWVGKSTQDTMINLQETTISETQIDSPCIITESYQILHSQERLLPDDHSVPGKNDLRTNSFSDISSCDYDVLTNTSSDCFYKSYRYCGQVQQRYGSELHLRGM